MTASAADDRAHGLLHWLRQTLVPSPGPLPWPSMLRWVLCILGPLLAADALGASKLAVALAIGGLCGAFADKGGSLHQRVTVVATAVVLAAVGFTIGTSVAHAPAAIAAVVLVAVAVLSALLPALGAPFVVGGFQMLLISVVASGVGVSAAPPVAGLLVLAGGAVALAVTTVYALAGGARPGAAGEAAFALHAVATAMRSGSPSSRDAVDSAFRSIEQRVRTGSSRRRRAVRAFLDEALPLQEATLALTTAGGTSARLADAVDRLARAVQRRQHDGADLDAARHAQAEDGGDPETARLRGTAEKALRRAATAWSRGEEHEPEDESRVPPALRSLPGRLDVQLAVRLALCVAVAEVLRVALPVPRTYWIVLTVALVLKPDFGSVFVRSLQRAIGTLAGVLVAALVLALVPHAALLVPLAVFVALAPLAFATSYALFSAVITPVFLGLIDLGGTNALALTEPRVIDTLLGSAVVLVVGYACWPPVWHSNAEADLGRAVDALSALERSAFERGGLPTRERRRVYGVLASVRSSQQNAAAEPPPVSTRAAAWSPFVGAVQRTADEVVVAATLAVTDAGARPGDEDLQRLRRATDDLGSALRDHRGPGDEALPGGPLAAVCDGLREAREALADARG